MKEFLGIGGYTRTPEGFLSWQHLMFVGILMALMVITAVFLGIKNKTRTLEQKNHPLIYASVIINAVEIFKIAILCYSNGTAETLPYYLPLFLCSIQHIAIPLAAFTKGTVKEASLDFVCIFGILGAFFGTVGAGQNYNSYPVLSLENVSSGLSHVISGFASLYIMISGLASLKRKNIGITFAIILSFCSIAYIANLLIPYNYMFLMAGDGTPYDIIYNLVGGSRILYPLSVVGLFIIYIAVFYLAVHIIRKKNKSPELVPEK